MQAAKGKGSPPPVLQLRWRCRNWNLPPKTGGMNDQDYRAIAEMDLVETVYQAVKAWRHAAEYPRGYGEHEKKVINWLVEIGVM